MQRRPDLLDSVILPLALRGRLRPHVSRGDAPADRDGIGPLISQQVPIALDPNTPENFEVKAPARPRSCVRPSRPTSTRSSSRSAGSHCSSEDSGSPTSRCSPSWSAGVRSVLRRALAGVEEEEHRRAVRGRVCGHRDARRASSARRSACSSWWGGVDPLKELDGDPRRPDGARCRSDGWGDRPSRRSEPRHEASAIEPITALRGGI